MFTLHYLVPAEEAKDSLSINGILEAVLLLFRAYSYCLFFLS